MEKKYLQLLFIMSLLFLTASGRLFSLDLEFGVRIGMVRSKSAFSQDLPFLTIKPITDQSLNAHLSISFMGDQLWVQPEIGYTVKGFDVRETDLGEDISTKYKISYVSFAMLLVYRVPLSGRIRPGFVFGPYLGYPQKVIEVQSAFGEIQKREMGNNLKNTDVGIVLGPCVCYEIGIFKFLLSVRYSLGLANLSRDIQEVSMDFHEGDQIKNRALTASLGLILDLSRPKKNHDRESLRINY